MDLEGDLRNVTARTPFSAVNRPLTGDKATGASPYVGVTPTGTPVVYRGSDKRIAESEANKNAELQLRAIQKGIAGKTSISLNTDTGNIKVSAPKAILESAKGQGIINNDTLMAMSQAYKLNPDYKISYTERGDDGAEIKTEVTIPEYISKLDSALTNLAQNMRNADALRYALVAEYGDKAEKMTDDMIRMSVDYEGNAIPIATFIANSEKLKGLTPYVDENGYVKTEDLKNFYNRDKLGREEMAALYGEINARLKNGSWKEDEYYTTDDGEEILDQNNINEMAKALAFKNYILTHDPDANVWQQIGDNIETLSLSALNGFTRVFANIANVGQAIVTFGQGQDVQKWIQEADKSMSQFQQDEMLVNDATATTYTLGLLGGSLLGTIASAWLGGEIAGGVAAGAGKIADAATSKALASVASALGTAGKGATSVKSALELAKNAEDVSRGALFVLRIADGVQKAQIAAGVAKAFLNSHKTANFIVDFLTDTVHDALLYDSTTLREALQNSDEETRNYWLGQLADNAKWWAGMGAAKTLVKWSGKTTLGQAANVLGTKLNAKIATAFGGKWADIKDTMAGGSVVDKLQKQLDDAVDKGNLKKANRLRNKIQQERWNAALRSSKEQLAKMKLDWDGLKLTDKSGKKYNDVMTRIKALNNGIDAYNRNITFKRQEMVGKVRDPATGKWDYINPDLGGANEKATQLYIKISEALSKHNIPADPDSLITQAVTDYMMGSYHLEIAKAFSEAGGEMAAKATEAIPKIEKNIAAAKAMLPDDVVKIVDNGLSNKTYQSFYAQMNEYGRSKGLLNKEKTRSYEANQIWAENGYMPIVVEHTRTGHWETDTGRVDAVIDQDFQKMTFDVKDGQHYVDPEIVRQTRISTMARAEVNRDLFKAYSGYGSNATNITKISGEDTEYVRKVNENKKALDTAVEKDAAAFAENFEVELQKQRRAKPVKNVTVSKAYREEAISALSLGDTTQLLLDKGTLTYRGQKMTDGVTRANYDEWYNGQSKEVKKYLEYQYSMLGKAGDRGFDALQTSIEVGGADFEAGLQRAFLIGDPEFARSSTMNEAMRNIQNGKQAFYEGVVKARAKANLRNVTTVKVDGLVDDISDSIEKNIDTFVSGVTEDAGAKAAIKALSENSNGADETGRYIALRQLAGDKKARAAAYQSIDDSIDKVVKGKNMVVEDVDNIKKQAHYMFDEMLESQLDDAANSARTYNASLVDSADIYDKAKALNDEIVSAEKAVDADDGSGTVMYLDSEGRQVFAEVDPAFASLFNYRYKMDKTEASVFAKVNAAMSRIYRYGTTSVNLSAFGNQLFRDFGNAVLVGGAWQTIRTNADNLVDIFGENIVDQIKRFDPEGYEMRQIEQLAEKTGRTVEQAAVSRELMRGAAISPTTTERTLYRDFMKQAYGSSDNMLDNMKTTFQSIVDKYDPDELLNGKRENYLRNRVYASSLNDAMTNGYTLDQARVYAEFAMNNATTNFSRQLYHMQAIADSTPYFRAAINGTKSFWRMWSLDPVGITGRIMGGLILPTMYLTGASLASKEDREVYMNIPEYQKADSMVFVQNGSIVSVPIPQELSSIVAPFRHFVEYLHDSNENDFWELMQSDVLGLSPIDLTAFTTVDMDKVISDPTLLDRMSRGTARVFSQMAPIPIKTAYMLATGVDPYTGKRLNDPSYSWYDETSDSIETMSYEQNAFAKWFASLFGDNMSPYLAEKIVSGIIGSTGINMLGDVTSLLQEGPEAWANSAVSNVAGQLTKPFYEESYDLADAAWKRAVRELTAEKNAILADKDFKLLLSELSQTKDPEKRKKLSAQIQDRVNSYQQKVGDAVERLGSEYKGTFDRKKFAAVIQLLNFNTDAAYQDGTQLSSDRSSATFWSGRNAAVQTMQRLGVDGTNDMSIFGYGTVNKQTGEIEIRYSDPVAIMDAENVWNSQKDLHLANIKAMVSRTGLWDAKKAIDDQVNAIYAKKKLKDADYDQINSIYINWNAQVMSALAPYIEEMTPEAAINNSAVMDYLDGLIEVPSEFKKDRYGRYVTNKKLGEGSAKDAYIKNYIRKIYGVNSTGYTGGKDYSGR